MIYPTALLHLIKPSNTIIKIPLLDTIQFQPLNDDNSWSISVHSKAIIVSVQRMDSFHFHLPTLALLLRFFSPPPMARSHLAITFVSIKDWKRALIKQSIFLFYFRGEPIVCAQSIFFWPFPREGRIGFLAARLFDLFLGCARCIQLELARLSLFYIFSHALCQNASPDGEDDCYGLRERTPSRNHLASWGFLLFFMRCWEPTSSFYGTHEVLCAHSTSFCMALYHLKSRTTSSIALSHSLLSLFFVTFWRGFVINYPLCALKIIIEFHHETTLTAKHGSSIWRRALTITRA